MTAHGERTPQTALRVPGLERSVRFYSGLPDFGLAWHEGPVACLVGPGGTPLLLAGDEADLSAWSAVPQAGPGAMVYLHRTGLPALSAELAKRGLRGAGPSVPYPGYRQLLMPDPDGYLLTFWESLPLRDEQVLELYRTGSERLNAAMANLDEAGGCWR